MSAMQDKQLETDEVPYIITVECCDDVKQILEVFFEDKITETILKEIHSG